MIVDPFQVISAGSVLTLVGVCVHLAKHNGNGSVSNDYIRRPECHAAQKGIHSRIDDMDKHLDHRFEDLKDFIVKNGKGKN